MEGFIGFIFGALAAGAIAGLATYANVNSSWKNDCEKIGYHLDTSSEQKVFKCELKK